MMDSTVARISAFSMGRTLKGPLTRRFMLPKDKKARSAAAREIQMIRFAQAAVALLLGLASRGLGDSTLGGWGFTGMGSTGLDLADSGRRVDAGIAAFSSRSRLASELGDSSSVLFRALCKGFMI